MQALIFLLDAVIGFFCALFLLRFMMQAMRVSFTGQLGNFVVALTNWAVKPLRRIIPGIGGLDWSSVFVAFALQLLFAAIVVAASDPFRRSGRPQPGPNDSLVCPARRPAHGGLHLHRRPDPASRTVMDQPLLATGAPAQQLTRPLLDPTPPLHPADFRH
jgi:YggT family protein